MTVAWGEVDPVVRQESKRNTSSLLQIPAKITEKYKKKYYKIPKNAKKNTYKMLKKIPKKCFVMLQNVSETHWS